MTKINQAIQDQAVDWFMRMSDGGPDSPDAEDFQNWLDQDPLHAKAYAYCHKIWQDVPDQLGHLAPLANDRHRWAGWPEILGAAWSRFMAPLSKAGLGGALAAVLMVGLSFYWFTPSYWFQSEPSSAPMTTAIGEMRQIDLPDGSQVTLAPRSRLTVAYSDQMRAVTLQAGEAFFMVAKDRTRPFVVTTDGIQVQAVGTAFNVHKTAGSLQVAVLEGLVDVADIRPGGPAEDGKRLRAGQQVSVQKISGQKISGRKTSALSNAVLEDVPLADIAAWRSGRLIYVDTPLGDVLSDVRRYYAGEIRLQDTALSEKRITVAFKAGEIELFFSSLATVLPVHISYGQQNKVVIMAKK